MENTGQKSDRRFPSANCGHGEPQHLAAERDTLTELAERIELLLTIDGHPGVEIDETDLRVIKFALRFTAARL